MRSRLDGHPPGDLAHGRQQRQAAALVGHGLVGDGHGTAIDQPLGLLGIGRQVEIGEQHLIGAQHGDFRRLRLLHLDHHLGPGEDFLGAVDDFSPGGDVVVVVEANGMAGLGLYQRLVAMFDQLAHRGRRQPHPVFLDLDLLGNPDQHLHLLIVLESWGRVAITRPSPAGKGFGRRGLKLPSTRLI